MEYTHGHSYTCTLMPSHTHTHTDTQTLTTKINDLVANLSELLSTEQFQPTDEDPK